MKTNFLLLIIVLLIFSCNEKDKGTSLNQRKLKNFILKADSLLTIYDKNGEFMGSLELSRKGKSIYSKTTGYSDIESKKRADSNTKYRIGSITKTFTAVLIFKAIEENKIQLNQTIDNFFPTLSGVDKITIAHLLHHQSGIMSYTKDQYFWDNRTQNQSAKDLMNVISRLDRNFEPGENTEYSNSNYFLLTQLLETIYGNNYENLLKKNIIQPLGLQDTYVGKTTNSDNNESFSYTSENGDWKLFPETHLSIAKGSGSLISTPSDLNIFFRSLINGKLISPASLEKMTTIIRNHGMGVFRYSLHDQSGFGHGGNIDGFTANAIYFKDIDVALSITSNASSIPINEVYSEILNLYLGEQEIAISEDDIKKYVGIYASEENPSEKTVFDREGSTLIHVIKGEFRVPLVYKGNRRFLFNQMYAESISFTFSEDGNELIFEQGNFKGKYIKE